MPERIVSLTLSPMSISWQSVLCQDNLAQGLAPLGTAYVMSLCAAPPFVFTSRAVSLRATTTLAQMPPCSSIQTRCTISNLAL